MKILIDIESNNNTQSKTCQLTKLVRNKIVKLDSWINIDSNTE